MNSQTFILSFRSFFSVPKLIKLIDGILITGIAWSGGSFTSKVVEQKILQVPPTKERVVRTRKSVQNQGKPFSDFNAITEMNVFDVRVQEKKKEVVKVKQKLEQKAAIEKPVSASLSQILNNLELRGITSGAYYFATIYHKQKRMEDVLITGDEVFDTGAVISGFVTKKEPKKVLIQLGEEIGSLLLNPESKAEKNAAKSKASKKSFSKKRSSKKDRPKSKSFASKTSYTKNGKDYFFNSAEIDRELNDFPRLLNQARVIPFMQNGTISGFQIKLIEKNSLYDRMGFKNKDIIQDVNGEFLGTPEKAMKLLSALRNEREISVSILRNGVPKTLSYHIN